jgi:hypothetical protein
MRGSSELSVALSLVMALVVAVSSVLLLRQLGLAQFVSIPIGIFLVSLTCYPLARAVSAKSGKTLRLRTWTLHVTLAGLLMLILFYLASYQ